MLSQKMIMVIKDSGWKYVSYTDGSAIVKLADDYEYDYPFQQIEIPIKIETTDENFVNVLCDVYYIMCYGWIDWADEYSEYIDNYENEMKESYQTLQQAVFTLWDKISEVELGEVR